MPETSWIFDSVSISNFIIADAQDLLVELYPTRMVIPAQVHDELLAGFIAYPKLTAITNLIDTRQLKVVALNSAERADYLSYINRLGRGEAACIVIAHKRGFTMVTDDYAARRECTTLKLRLTGTIGILKSACLKKKLTPESADKLLKAMQGHGYYSPVSSISSLL